jgi:hypothetical protein
MKIVLFSVGLMAMDLFALSPTSRATPPGGGFHSGGLAAPGLMGQTTVHITQAPAGRVQVPRVQLNLTPQLTANPSNVRIAGFPSSPTLLPYPLASNVRIAGVSKQPDSASVSTGFHAREQRLGAE